jgi:hypothetical protein
MDEKCGANIQITILSARACSDKSLYNGLRKLLSFIKVIIIVILSQKGILLCHPERKKQKI